MTLEDIIEKVTDAKKLLLEIEDDMREADDGDIDDSTFPRLAAYVQDAYDELADLKDRLKALQESKEGN